MEVEKHNKKQNLTFKKELLERTKSGFDVVEAILESCHGNGILQKAVNKK